MSTFAIVRAQFCCETRDMLCLYECVCVVNWVLRVNVNPWLMNPMLIIWGSYHVSSQVLLFGGTITVKEPGFINQGLTLGVTDVGRWRTVTPKTFLTGCPTVTTSSRHPNCKAITMLLFFPTDAASAQMEAKNPSRQSRLLCRFETDQLQSQMWKTRRFNSWSIQWTAVDWNCNHSKLIFSYCMFNRPLQWCDVFIYIYTSIHTLFLTVAIASCFSCLDL